MGSFLDKILPRKPGKPTAGGKGGRSLVKAKGTGISRRGTAERDALYDLTEAARDHGRVPNASIVYGLASAVLFVLAFFAVFFEGSWGRGVILLLPAGVFFGFAVYFIRYQSPE